jgi:hypothetical protein
MSADLTHYSVRAVSIDACRNQSDHNVEKYCFLPIFIHYLYKSVSRDEIHSLKFIPLGVKVGFGHCIIHAPCPVYTGIRY